MKKVIFSLMMGAMGLFAFAQDAPSEFHVGASLGLPVGDASDVSSFSLNIDANYLYEIVEDIEVGATTGYSHSFGKDDFDDVGFIPLAAAGRYEIGSKFELGLDLGYAFATNDGNDGGFYYSPKVQYGFDDKFDIVGAFRGISLDGGNFNMLSLGLEYEF